MTRHLALTITILLVLAAVGGCAASPAESPATSVDTVPSTPETPTAVVSTADSPNFLLLVSDDENAIADFDELWVEISGVGFVLGDQECVVDEMFTEPVLVNLVGLTEEAAIALWEGYVPEGEYTQVFLYVGDVWGLLPSGDVIEIKLPSDKLHLSLPVAVDEGEETDFVFDITVLRAGNSGQYILQPQVLESGQGVTYRLMEQTHERVRHDQPEWAGGPEWAGQGDANSPGPREDTGKPEWTPGQGQDQNQDDQPAMPGGAGKPDNAGRPDDAGKSSHDN